MAYKKPIIQQALEKTGWKEFKSEGQLPQSAKDYFGDYFKEFFRYPGGWNRAFYRGENPDKATEWVVVTNNGGFYKVFAIYMVWWLEGEKRKATARWSDKSLKEAIVSILHGKNPPMDPNYHT